ncbi:MAG: hypothetical protein VCA55_15805 [Verrucomicrobiales bacterium]
MGRQKQYHTQSILHNHGLREDTLSLPQGTTLLLHARSRKYKQQINQIMQTGASGADEAANEAANCNPCTLINIRVGLHRILGFPWLSLTAQLQQPQE